MKNHYVMNENSVMVFRGTRQECVTFCKTTNSARRSYGLHLGTFRIFYDTATEPSETINN